MQSIKFIVKTLFASISMSIQLMFFYAIVIGAATFIEKYYGSIVAYDVIYNSWWFEALNIWLAILLCNCMILNIKYNSFRLGMQIFHLAFLLALLGAAITRYYGVEGLMSIDNNQTSNTITTTKKYLNIFVSQDIETNEFLKTHENQINMQDKRFSQYGTTQSVNMPLSPYNSKKIDYTFNIYGKTLHIKSIEVSNLSQVITDNLYVAKLEISYGNETRYYHILNNGEELSARFANHIIALSWKPKEIVLPFAIHLKQFHLEMYPGSDRHSSYSSSIEVIDKDLTQPIPYEIYMNHVLDYKGYRFFQHSYNTQKIALDNGDTQDEYTGTILSVNKDPGKIPTYIAYSMMIIGGIWLLFDKRGRFAKLGILMKHYNPIMLCLGLICMPYFSHGTNHNTLNDIHTHLSQKSQAIILADSHNTTTHAIDMHGRDEALNPTFTDKRNLLSDSPSSSPLQQSSKESNIQDSVTSNTPSFNNSLPSTTKTTQSQATAKDSINQPSSHQELYENEAFKRYGDLESLLSDRSNVAITQRFNKLKEIPQAYLDSLARLQIQDFDGRLKPLDTFALELMRKITHANHDFKGLNPMQFLVGIMVFPLDMMSIRLIYVDNLELLRLLGVNHGKYVAFKDVFDMQTLMSGGSYMRAYKIYNLIEDAMRKPPATQTAFDKEVLKLNEKINYIQSKNIWSYLRIFVYQGKWFSPNSDEVLKVLNAINDWYLGAQTRSHATQSQDSSIKNSQDSKQKASQSNQSSIVDSKKDESNVESQRIASLEKILDTSTITPSFAISVNAMSSYLEKEFSVGILKNDWSALGKVLDSLHKMQQDEGRETLLRPSLINMEIMLNHFDIFSILQKVYLLLGILSFLMFLYSILKNKALRFTHKIAFFMLCLCFIIHTLGLIMRWYIANHAPWSNAYESMIYIAWASVLAGVILMRQSFLTLCATSFLSGIILMVSHLGFMDPQISNLVPVLKSYWLNIHVSVIVASYGFFGLSAMLGILALLLFALRSNKRTNLDNSIIVLNILNERSMMIGIVMLTIGTFLGGIWANESWGRYWGWDAKETWSLASIAIYACILHIRLLKPLYLPYIFSVCSVLGFYSILMTYFGVNYYLAGMHSYAKGESQSIPLSVILPNFVLVVMIAIGFFRRKLTMPNLSH